MTLQVLIVVGLIFTALCFDFINGFHDAASSIATVVSTRVLSPLQAVAWAAFFNFVAAFTVGTAVAKTVGSGMIDVSVVDPNVVLGGLLGAILWNLITWFYGLPSSSSHALIGGYAGAAVAKGGLAAIIWGSKWTLTLLFIVLSPVIGMLLGSTLMILVTWIFHRSTPGRVNRFFAETGCALCILLAARFGIPVSTTHTITGSIVGVGMTYRARAVRWGIAGRIVWAWILTIPAACFIAAVSYAILGTMIRM